MATLYDVARRAGVSPKTVSRVVNREARVSDQTREAVQKAIAEVEYVPSLAARSIRSRRSALIGLITGAISAAGDQSGAFGLPEILIVNGAQQVFGQSGQTLLIADTAGKTGNVPQLFRTFSKHRVEGILYVAPYHQEVAEALPVGGAPTVLVNCFDRAGTPAVLPDDEGGQLALARKVVAAGHRRIAYLCLNLDIAATPLRIRGLSRALAEAGIAYDPDLVVPADMPGQPGEHQLIRDALDRLLNLPDPPTAVCCGNDRLALAVYSALRERGLSIPDDISVTGFDDHRMISETLSPPLTTVELPYAAMGARAAELLLDLISGRDGSAPTEPVLVSSPLQMRQSLRPPG